MRFLSQGRESKNHNRAESDLIEINRSDEERPAPLAERPANRDFGSTINDLKNANFFARDKRNMLPWIVSVDSRRIHPVLRAHSASALRTSLRAIMPTSR
jgi:hypothetical protein